MNPIPSSLADRLDALKASGAIAGWQNGGGTNFGLGRAPLPLLIFPLNFGPAVSYYSTAALETAVKALETFGDLVLV